MSALVVRCWTFRRWLLWVPLAILLLPLAWGQGWIGESVLLLLTFNGGVGNLFAPVQEPTRILIRMPLALALLSPWPEWVIASLVVGSWLLAAGITYAIVVRLLPGDRIAAVVAFFLVGTSAYDTSLLRDAYLGNNIAAVLHWMGILALVIHCEKRSARWLIASAALQCLSLLMYGTAVAAIGVGPLLAVALIATRFGYRQAARSFVPIALAWWAPLVVYLTVVARSAMEPASYIARGLRFGSGSAALVLRLIAVNFLPTEWLHPVPGFGNPTRIFGPAIVWTIASAATAVMLLLLAGALTAKDRGASSFKVRGVFALLAAAIVLSNMATALVPGAAGVFRTHLVSRLYASVLIAALYAALLRSRLAAVRIAGGMLTLCFLLIGAWTVVDRADYLVSEWPQHRVELRSLDAIVRQIDPSAQIVLYEPPGAGYTATVAPWHASFWLSLIRGPFAGASTFALWSPDRGAVCRVLDTDLLCEGDMQPLLRFPLGRIVLLRYDVADCHIKLVDRRWVDSSKPDLPHDYSPQRWMRRQSAAMSPLFGKLLYGPQGLGSNVGCRPARASRLEAAGPATLAISACVGQPLIAIDRIGSDGAPFDKGAVRVRGAFRVEGWAVDRESGSAAAAVDVVIDQTPFQGFYGFERLDVSDYFARAAYRESGFTADIDKATLSKGPHRLSLRVVSSSRGCYYESPGMPIEIE